MFSRKTKVIIARRARAGDVPDFSSLEAREAQAELRRVFSALLEGSSSA
jgi:hypothetical protein